MMYKTFVFLAIALFAVSCRHASKPSDALAAANMEALEQTVDMENGTVERDAVLKFRQAVVDLGTVPLGESREATGERNFLKNNWFSGEIYNL